MNGFTEYGGAVDETSDDGVGKCGGVAKGSAVLDEFDGLVAYRIDDFLSIYCAQLRVAVAVYI